jgi:hypothetical protein
MESTLHTPLIPGLPDEIALICLARVPRRYHNVLRCVSQKWRAKLCSAEWLSCRKRNNLDESWIYLICRETGTKCYVLAPDPSNCSMKIMHITEPPCAGRQGVSVEVLGKSLFLLGGCIWLNDPTDEVYCYDASSNRWSIAVSMPTARYICKVHFDAFFQHLCLIFISSISTGSINSNLCIIALISGVILWLLLLMTNFM